MQCRIKCSPVALAASLHVVLRVNENINWHADRPEDPTESHHFRETIGHLGQDDNEVEVAIWRLFASHVRAK